MYEQTAEAAKPPHTIEPAAIVAIAVAWAAVLMLIVMHDTPPIIDWPNHMARHYLESLWLSGKPLPPFYEIHYRLMPNLGSDLIVPELLLVFDTITASKIFLVLAVFLYWSGPTAFILQYGERSPSAWAVCTLIMPWLLAGTFFWGFMNYYSGVGLAFLAAANHVRIARLERAPVWQLILHSALLVLLYLWHLTSIGIYLVLAGCFMLEGFFKAGVLAWARTLRVNLPFVVAMLPALAVMIFVMMQPKLNALSGGVVWSTPLRKLVLAFGYFGAYDLWTDVPLIAAWGLALLLLFRLAARRPIVIDYAGLAAVAFAVLYVALPVELGTTSGADIRMLPPLFFTAAALLANLPLARSAIIGVGLMTVLALTRHGVIHTTWTAMEGDAKAIRAHFAQAKPRSKVLVLTLDRASKNNFQSHLIGWAVPASDAYVSSLFSYAGQQPLTLLRETSEATVSDSDGKLVMDAAAVAAGFDYVWLFNPQTPDLVLPAGWTFVLGEGAGKLYRAGAADR